MIRPPRPRIILPIESFSRFLEVAALTNTHVLDYTSVASHTGIPARTVREHYQMLEDTLIGFQLQPYRGTRRRKPVATAKFFLFDVGVANALMKRGEIRPHSELYGAALEHQVFLELRAYLEYRRLDLELTFWRTHAGHEVDFVIGDDVAIEVKASRRVTGTDLKGLLAFGEEVRPRLRIAVSTEPRERRTDEGVLVLPVSVFFERLWNDELVE